jgi:hypothetical protein
MSVEEFRPSLQLTTAPAAIGGDEYSRFQIDKYGEAGTGA